MSTLVLELRPGKTMIVNGFFEAFTKELPSQSPSKSASESPPSPSAVDARDPDDVGRAGKV